MNTALATVAVLLGRMLLGGFFLYFGLQKFGSLEGTAGYIASQGLPLPAVLAFATAALEALGGLALIVGLQARGPRSPWPRSRCWRACCSTPSGPCRPSSSSCSS